MTRRASAATAATTPVLQLESARPPLRLPPPAPQLPPPMAPPPQPLQPQPLPLPPTPPPPPVRTWRRRSCRRGGARSQTRALPSACAHQAPQSTACTWPCMRTGYALDVYCRYVAQVDGGYIHDRFYRQDAHLSHLFPRVRHRACTCYVGAMHAPRVPCMCHAHPRSVLISGSTPRVGYSAAQRLVASPRIAAHWARAGMCMQHALHVACCVCAASRHGTLGRGHAVCVGGSTCRRLVSPPHTRFPVSRPGQAAALRQARHGDAPFAPPHLARHRQQRRRVADRRRPPTLSRRGWEGVQGAV